MYGEDEEVLNKMLSGAPISVEAASNSKEEVTVQASHAEVPAEATTHSHAQAEAEVPEVAPHTSQELRTEEVTSQTTVEMSVEDESVKEEEDPFAEERKEVLHELEVVANEKDAKHALMESLKLQIQQLEVSNDVSPLELVLV